MDLGDRYIDQPPSGPPMAGQAPVQPAPEKPRRAGKAFRLVAAGAAIAMISGASGAYFGDRAASDRDSVVNTAAGVPAPVSLPVAAAGALAAEPAALAAAAVAPSVVQVETGTGLGSGFIYADGRILTNAHVVGDADQVSVRLSNGTVVPGTVLGSDTPTDVAVVSVANTDGLPIAALASGVELAVGQGTVAVGSPFGLDQTVTAGVVSAVDRAVPNGETAIGMVQTDAAINSGNSGGALADLSGRVIGINSSIRSASGGNDGIGFAIPIDTALWVANLIEQGEPVTHGLLGVTLDTPLQGRAGALVTSVTDGSAADQAGLLGNDLVVTADGDTIQSSLDLVAKMRVISAGTTVTFEIVRGGEEIQLTLATGVR